MLNASLLPIFIGLILFLGFCSVIGNVQLYYFYRHLGDEVDELQGIDQSQDWSKWTRNTSKGLLQVMERYLHFRSSGVEWVNTQALMEEQLVQERIRFLGIFSLPVGVVERIVKQVPSWVMIMGLLGTFTGLTIALFSMQQTLFTFGTQSAELITVPMIIAAIAEPFQGMSLAFLTSITGVGTAFILYLLHSGFFGMLGIGPNFQQEKESFLSVFESFLDHDLQHFVQLQKPQDTWERILDRFADKVKDSFDQSVHQFGNSILRLTEGFEQQLGATKETMERVNQSVELFTHGTKEWYRFGSQLKDFSEQLQASEEQVAHQIGQLNTHLNTMQHEIQVWIERLHTGQTETKKILERSDQVLQLITKKHEEIFQNAKRQMEEALRHQASSLEEVLRREGSKQEEWHYRFQEKQDQMSRAAESFGQAVVHLQRVFEEGLERMKRDSQQQLQVLVERFVQRNQSGQGQEWRELSREIAQVYHLLERELHGMQRNIQEGNQVLHALYEWGRGQTAKRYPAANGEANLMRDARY